MVFQNYALFPHMTVAENVAFPLKHARRRARPRSRGASPRRSTLVQLPGYGERYPRQLSGGQQQRVALARAIVFKPRLLLMDEPLGALDKQLREQMQLEMQAPARELGITIIYVTHDQEEALTMSDRIAVMNDGQDRADRHARGPLRPADDRVRRRASSASRISCPPSCAASRTTSSWPSAKARSSARCHPTRPAAGEKVMLTTRPERLRFADGAWNPAIAQNRLQRHGDRGGVRGRTLPLHAAGRRRHRHGAEGAVECRDPPARGRRAGRDRLVGRGYDPCLRRSSLPDRARPVALMRRAGTRARPEHHGSARVPFLLVAPLVVFMLAFYALPVVAMLMRSVSDPVWSVANYAALPDDVVFLKTFSNTFYTSLIVTLATLLMAYPVALALVRAPRWAPLILILILLPFWTSVLVRSYAWMVLMGRHGLINEALTAAGLLERPLRILNTPLATQIAMTHILLPYMILPIANALRQIDPSLLRASSGLGAPPWRTFLQVTLPLSMPGVAAGVLLVFVLALGFYITPAMVGGPREITLSMLIAQQVDHLNWAYAATLSAVLLATSLALIGICYRLPGVGNAFRMNVR